MANKAIKRKQIFGKNPDLLINGKKPRNKVSLNRNHHFARDLRFQIGVYGNEVGEKVVNLATGKPSTGYVGTTRDFGAITFTDKFVDQIKFKREDILEPSNLTLIARANIRQDVNIQGLVSKAYAVHAEPFYSYDLNFYPTQVVFAFNRSGVNGFVAIDMNQFWEETLWFAATFGPISIHLYVLDQKSKVLRQNTTTGGNEITYDDTDLTIGVRVNDAIKGLADGSIVQDVAIWGHQKDIGEIQEFIRRPYAAYESQ